MGKIKYDQDDRGGGSIETNAFPWKWFIFFLICLPAGGQGIVFFLIVLAFVKVFTNITR
ncbi:hypothetical protein [Dolichospermum sp. UHCC 0259]|uniref:hypothetical protein n=1 Tax=Dolichospermum sp. UHCC 0259 TaxID=2590010 RepID=UPI001444D511|nr:hypothetical protein [Dolichospermum sp. UHCC 0259]